MEKYLEKYAISEQAAQGMKTVDVIALQEKYGFNELDHIEVSKFKLFVDQFRGTMPYMLEVALLVAAAVRDWPDVGIIAAMLIANGILGFKEELECLEKLEELTKGMESKVSVYRDGIGLSLPTRELVVGDVILMLGGLQVSDMTQHSRRVFYAALLCRV